MKKNSGMRQKMVLACVALASVACRADRAKVGAVILDEVTEKPVPGVTVLGIFEMKYGWEAFTSSKGNNTQRAVTDAQGRCRMSGKTNVGRTGVVVREVPNGYYVSHAAGGYDHKEKNLFGVWQPDNLVVTIRLQRVEHPIPLFVKQVGKSSPDNTTRKNVFPGREAGEKISFDMMVGDWLPPVGAGKVADVVFERLPRQELGEAVNVLGKKVAAFRESMSVAFPGADNGLVEVPVNPGHALKIRQAPETGYDAGFTAWFVYDKECHEQMNYKRDRCFCFRIRTKRNEKGEIVQAYYGKIYGDVFFATQEQPFVVLVAMPSMRYYLNPTSMDRNLEWNMKNLCKDPGELNSPEP